MTRLFAYQLVRLFDFNARDYYESQNPVVKILMPRMIYAFEERTDVLQQAYLGLYQLVTPMLFDKFIDFIDMYEGVQEEEWKALTRAIEEKIVCDRQPKAPACFMSRGLRQNVTRW